MYTYTYYASYVCMYIYMYVTEYRPYRAHLAFFVAAMGCVLGCQTGCLSPGGFARLVGERMGRTRLFACMVPNPIGLLWTLSELQSRGLCQPNSCG